MTAPTDPSAPAAGTSPTVLLEVSEGIATITLNRPAARNALSAEMLAALPAALADADRRDDVRVIILTGADPAFCAGLDLGELGGGGMETSQHVADVVTRRPWTQTGVPVIGAINGAAVTGGFELALNCDFLVASERAKFGDTHARVGVMPGWGLTVLLPQAIGIRRAREMSFTGNFMTASEALQWGLVNRVVAHDELLPVARSIAADIAGNDPAGVRQIRATYAEIHAAVDGLAVEHRDSIAWQRTMFSPDRVAERRAALQARGKAQ